MLFPKLRFSYLIFIGIVYSSCVDIEKEIEGDWIAKYTIDPNGDVSDLFEKEIYSFDKDSVLIRNYQFKTLVRKPKEEKKSYKIIEKGIKPNLTKRSGELSIAYISTDSLMINDSGKKLVLAKLSKFNTKFQKEKFNHLLRTYNFQITESDIELEFLPRFDYVSNTLFDFTSKSEWKIDGYENELFLTFSGGLGPMLQLKELKETSIVFKLYHANTKEVKFERSTAKPKYFKEQLIGIWKEEMRIVEKDTLLKKELDDLDDIPDLSNLIIRDSVVQFRWGNEVIRERNWFLSKSGEIIIFNEPWPTEEKFQWNIVKLDEKYLEIEKRKQELKISKVVYLKHEN